MSYLLGRFFQLIGMVILPIALYIGAVRGEVRTEVKLLAIGGFFFLLGWLLSRKVEQ